MLKKFTSVVVLAGTIGIGASAFAEDKSAETVADEVIAQQRAALAAATKEAGYGPQAPRDLTKLEGENSRSFGSAPYYTKMNLCNIHFHENAEHRGGQFTTYAGNGDGHGKGTGFKYDGELSATELAPLGRTVGKSKYGDLEVGDTIEIHFVHSSAQVTPGPTLGACVSKEIGNPQLRVETVVAVLVNNSKAADFVELAKIEKTKGVHRAVNLPHTLGKPIRYAGSTTGPSYNEKGSPYQVTWSVRPDVLKLDISSVEAWLADNPFNETGAHGVRNLVTARHLLSPIR